MNSKEFYQHIRSLLPEHEAHLLLFHFLHRIKSDLTSPSQIQESFCQLLSEIEMQDILDLALRRKGGEPLQHLTGIQNFYGLDLKVNNSTLIPRPETEVLISEALQTIGRLHQKNQFHFFEFGLGTGALSIHVLKTFQNAYGSASEIIPDAIAVAIENLDTHILNWRDRFTIIEPPTHDSGFEILAGQQIDVILANPPYLDTEDEIAKDVLKHEPYTALFPSDGEKMIHPNFFYENFLHHYESFLNTQGVAFFEVPHERADTILSEFLNAGLKGSALIADLTGRPRVIKATQL